MDEWKVLNFVPDAAYYIVEGEKNIAMALNKDTAEQIVKEHNLFPELVEALEKALNAMQEEIQYQADYIGETDVNTTEVANYVKAILDKVK
jgi:hypothetical protein